MAGDDWRSLAASQEAACLLGLIGVRSVAGVEQLDFDLFLVGFYLV